MIGQKKKKKIGNVVGLQSLVDYSNAYKFPGCYKRNFTY